MKNCLFSLAICFAWLMHTLWETLTTGRPPSVHAAVHPTSWEFGANHAEEAALAISGLLFSTNFGLIELSFEKGMKTYLVDHILFWAEKFNG